MCHHSHLPISPRSLSALHIEVSSNFNTSYFSLVELARLRRNGFSFRQQYGAFLGRFKMLCPHTWPAWHGPAVEVREQEDQPELWGLKYFSLQGVTYLLRGLPISAKEYAFGRSKIFIRTVSVLDQLEEWRKERLDELATLIQKIWRGWRARQNWTKLRESQIVICTYWKRWKDKSHITELKQRRKQEWAVIIIQKYYRRWQVGRWLIALAHNLPSESPVCRDWPRSPAIIKETSFLLRKLYHKWRVGTVYIYLAAPVTYEFKTLSVWEISDSVWPNCQE